MVNVLNTEHLDKKYGMSHQEIMVYRGLWRQQFHNNTKRKDPNGVPIEFKLTFEEWFDIWLASGHLIERGKGKGKYVMSRIGDLGHYEVGNVVIKLDSDNISESWLGGSRKEVRSQRIKAKKQNLPKFKCEYCGREFTVHMIARWHGSKCKEKGDEDQRSGN